MAISISPTLQTEMESLERLPVSRITVERFMPQWEAKISGLSAGKLEQYAHGHAALVVPDLNGAGEDCIFRARSGSFANPQNGILYIAFIENAELESPEDWEDEWTNTGISGLMYPAWTANSEAEFGASIAVAYDSTSGHFRVFVFTQDGNLHYYDFAHNGSAQGNGVIDTHPIDAAMQLGSCKFDEVFVLFHDEVEPGYAEWHKPVYGAKIVRYYYSSGWQTDNSFLYHTHADGHAVKDGVNFDDPSTETVTQWGKRPCGGMAVNQIDGNTVCVSLGMTWWRRWGYNTNSQGLFSYIYYRDSGGIWRRNFEEGIADYAKDLRFSVDCFARGSSVAGNQVVVWSRNDEPLDLEQTNGAERIPRLREVVYAKLDPTGRYLTHFQRLGSQDDLAAASIVEVDHNGERKLFALGWRGVYESPAASFLCTVPSTARKNLRLHATGYKVNRTNQWAMNVNVPLADASVLFETEPVVDEGNLIRVSYGIASELVQIGQGYIDLDDPTKTPRSHQGKLVARADKLLLDTRAESFEDVLPQITRNIPPDKPIKYVSRSAGYWQLTPANWPNLWFSGQYPNMVRKILYQLQSSMEAFTGGGQPGGGDTPPGQYGGGGKIWQTKIHKKGTFYSDVTWLAHSPMVDGAVQASVRFGDNIGQSNFEFNAETGCPVGTQIGRSNGLITYINWTTHDCGSAPDGVWNTVYQEACMAGLICHAIQIGKKYAFVWEANSDFDNASHLEDQAGRYWNSLVFDAPDFGSATYPPNLSGTKGPNRLYLILSDYDDTNPNWTETTQADRAGNPDWQDEQLWLHRYVLGGIEAIGLQPGKPAELKMQVLGGTIYCFYREYTEPIKSPWRFAFSYNAGRFGAGNFGIVGRGHSGIQWDVLWPGRDYINNCDNVVDFWDIKMTDGVEDKTMEESLRGYAWGGLTSTQFRSFVNDASISVTAGQLYSGFTTPPDFTDPLRIENLTINFDLQISASGGEAGVYCRAVDSANPKNDCVFIGLVVNSTYEGANNILNCYAVKRVYSGGVEDTTKRDYSPSPLHLKPGVKLPVRITVRGDLFSVWVAGNYIGHFGYFNETEAPPPETARGFYFGLYATGQNATFSNVYVPELFEIPTFALLDINQAMKDAMTKLIGKRKIKGVFRPTGELLLSYFAWNDSLPIFEDSLKQNQYQQSDRFVSVCHVEGAYTYAVYASPTLLPQGRRFLQYHNPDLMLPEHCYREAKMIIKELAEQQHQATFVGLPDIRVEPEDLAPIVVAEQNIDDDFLVDDVEFSFDLPKRQDNMQASTRKKVDV